MYILLTQVPNFPNYPHLIHHFVFHLTQVQKFEHLDLHLDPPMALYLDFVPRSHLVNFMNHYFIDLNYHLNHLVAEDLPLDRHQEKILLNPPVQIDFLQPFDPQFLVCPLVQGIPLNRYPRSLLGVLPRLL